MALFGALGLPSPADIKVGSALMKGAGYIYLRQGTADENRETATTRRHTPAASEARLAMRASEGPIFPPAPRTMMSPSRRPSVSTTPSVGSLRRSSSYPSAWMGFPMTSS